MERTRSPQQLSADETQQVLKRAAQLETRPVDAGEPSLDLAEVERIGLEAGLSREAIQRAFIELRSGSLKPPAPQTTVDKLLGPQSVQAERGLTLPSEEAKRRLHALLKSELLHPEERQGDRTVWSPTPGLWASIQRGINWQGQGAWQKGSITTEVLPAPAAADALCVVRIEGKPGARGNLLTGALLPGLSLLPMAFIVTLDPSVPGFAPVAIAAASLGFAGAGLMVARSVWKKRVRGLRLAMERVLEKLAGDPDEL